MEAQNAGSRVRVRIWVSASVGQVNVEDHYIGGYNVPHGTGLKATLGIGTARVDLKLEAQDELVEAVVNIHVNGFDDQKEITSAPITE